MVNLDRRNLLIHRSNYPIVFNCFKDFCVKYLNGLGWLMEFIKKLFEEVNLKERVVLDKFVVM